MLEQSLTNLPFFADVNRFVVAYSGGLDSLVLLHKVVKISDQLDGRNIIAVHINHGLSEKAAQWATHCAAHCESLGVSFQDMTVDANPGPGESPEATARAARYQALADFMQAGDCLLTAHHQDDQAETLLIQLLRGAGPRGLAAMPAYVEFAGGWHARPLLDQRRESLLEYAQQQNLSWIEDDSNRDTRFDRNFLRHDILPRLKSRFPSVASTLSRSAHLCAEAADLLVNTATDDLQHVHHADGSLSVSGLQSLGEVRARNLLHQWCRDRGLSTPSAAQLQCVWDEVIGAAQDSEPVVKWAGGEARRYRDALFIARPLREHDAALCLPWDARQNLIIPKLGELSVEPVCGQGLALTALSEKSLEIRFRQGGEKLHPVGREGHHALKKLFQEVGMPPWQRVRTPLLYAGEQLLAVAGHWVAAEVAAKADEPGICLHWVASG